MQLGIIPLNMRLLAVSNRCLDQEDSRRDMSIAKTFPTDLVLGVGLQLEAVA